ncbi:MAG: AI-2E family transporter [Steroidobacteraceae bacterium]
MSVVGTSFPKTRAQRAVSVALGVGLAALCLWILEPFLSPIAWATILAYVSWPAYRRVRKALRGSATGSAIAMSALVACMLIVPLLWVLLLARSELIGSLRPLAASLTATLQALPQEVSGVPWIGPLLGEELNRYAANPSIIAGEWTGWLQSWVGAFAAVLGELGRNVIKVLLTLLILFFFYRDGDAMVGDVSPTVKRLSGATLRRCVESGGAIVRAVFFGVIVAAVAQGVIAGVGYRLVGLNAPVLLGVLTGMLSVVPLLGTALVWAPIGIGMIVLGHLGQGLLLLAWGVLLIHPTDNLLHAIFVSKATRLPFLLAALGLVGGLAAFGLVGIFVGPMILGVGLELWRAWAARNSAPPRAY